jgi:3D (Asp-Asp-Asp) domain-containing protein
MFGCSLHKFIYQFFLITLRSADIDADHRYIAVIAVKTVVYQQLEKIFMLPTSSRSAPNFIAHYGVCTVIDRMNRGYRNWVDIAMKVTEKDKALQFGLKKLKVTILRSSDQKSKIRAVSAFK